MGIKHLPVVVVVTAGLLGFSGGAAVAATVAPSSLGYTGNHCTTSGFTNNVGVFYAPYNSAYWKLDHVNYLLSPADSSSDKNNVSTSLFGGSATASLGSTASAHRDAHWHTIWSVGGVNYLARHGSAAYVAQKVTFDRFGTDPSCTVKTYLP
jgi:hypothetical protein